MLKIPFSPPLFGKREEDLIHEVLQSGWVSRGPMCRRFEEEFAQYVGAPYAVSLSSCTAALHLALLAFDIGPGDEVITSAMTFPATVNAILYTGAKPVLADVKNDYNLDLDDLYSKVNEKTRAVILVDMHGKPCPFPENLPTNIKVIQDAAHSVGARGDRGKVGSYADATCFSFYPTKNMTAGEGGMLTTPWEKVAGRVRALSLHGMDQDAWKRYDGVSRPAWEVVELGYKYNMTDIQAAIGIAQLERLDCMNSRRYSGAQYYNELLQPLADRGALILPPEKEVWHLYAVRIQEPYIRDEIMEGFREAGIGCGVHFRSIEDHAFYRERLGRPDYAIPDSHWSSADITCPTAFRIGRETLSLPFHSVIPANHQEKVARVLTEFIS